jgi:hypothetical protein
MLDGIVKAGHGDFEGALRDTEPLLVHDAHGRHGDPFGRSVLHGLRSSWHRNLQNIVEAERDLRWVENMDITGWPEDQPQAVEIDWVFSVEVSHQRGLLAIARADSPGACDHFARVLRFWTDGLEPAIARSKRDVEQKRAVHCNP